MRPSIILVVALPLIVSGCAATVPPDVDTPDAQLLSSANPVRYRSPISGYVNRQPVDPKPWRQQNQSQSPAEGDPS
ncbi:MULTISPECIES: hypothetical protein [Rhizobium]|uniref:Lipoprotein n=1 Tax=Rhizobium gallicum bv. gallicum R602sp TaxID=1041138 RepID=A0A0B4X146_9HYPH|nr:MULTISPECIES: hypothetical protein [Rhizobium]AJD41659.1 hypothetical protein RGR602_CH02333 [Rhizobium gallicum bv. gallicum R602sp]